MKQVEKGICLTETEMPNRTRGEGVTIGICSLAAFLSLLCILLELSGFGRISNPLGIFLPGVVLCVLYAISVQLRRSTLFYFGAMIPLFLVVVLFKAQIMGGVYLLWNQFADTWVANTGKMLWSFQVDLSGQAYKTSIFLVSVLLGSMTAILGCLFSSYAPGALSVALPVLLIAGMMGMRNAFSGIGIVLVLCISVFLSLCGSRKICGSAIRILLSVLQCGGVMFALVVLVINPKTEQWTTETSRQIHQKWHEYRYETESTILPEGDFSDYTPSQLIHTPALEVTMTNPEPMYLRGFTGCVFEENVWQEQDVEVLAENQDVLYWLNLYEFHPAAQFAVVLPDTKQQSNLIFVENIGACSRYLYVPFSLQEGTYLQAEDLRTDSVVSEDGQRTYAYSTIVNADEAIADMIEQVQTVNSEEVYQYRRAETAYREYVQENYLQISDPVLSLLKEPWDDIVAAKGYAKKLTLQQAQDCTLAFLKLCFPPDGEAPFELPLNVAKGSNYQYATIAALTLRYYGIPARYVEGYVISDETIEKSQGSATLIVDNHCADAWAEVYQEGIGWLPMSLVPGLNTAQGTTNEIKNHQENQNNTPEPVDEEMMNEQLQHHEGKGTQVLLKKILLLLILLLLLSFFSIIIRRKILLNKKNKKFRSANIHNAVAWVFRDVVIMLKHMGFDRGNGSMTTLQASLENSLGVEYAQKMTDMIALNAEALFSSHHLEPTHRKSMMEFHNITLHHLKETTSIKKRLVLKWIYCLY